MSTPQLVLIRGAGDLASGVAWRLHRCGFPVAMTELAAPLVVDVALVKPVILEYPDPQGPLGARGMAEMPFIPTAAAIVAAVHDATGVWFDEIPLTPERVWRGLQGRTD
ncbi:MAG TPA: hypothetical protein PKM78_14970 [Anaerolineae bacterium]|nr:hypothetical protein [Anaerolineae bacterium]HNU03545.1 hypothetical protein [Anaerolineae bacterium]HNU05376.1 hypothetical protein [Anaerolineae bacterium]